MGSVNSAVDTSPNHPPKDYKSELNLSIKLSPHQVKKHLANGHSDPTQLTEIPNGILESVWLYDHFDVSFNKLKTIPKTLPLCLPHLTYLNLSYNQLEYLPNTVGLFVHLRTLLVPHNFLKELPDGLGWLTKLESLDVSHNSLTAFPDTLKTLGNLRKLNVSCNRLQFIPKYFGKFEKLSVILAVENECIDPAQEICNKGSDHLLDYIKRNADCVNGDGGVVARPGELFPRVYGSPLQVKTCQAAVQNFFQMQLQKISTTNRLSLSLLPPEGATVFHPEELRNRIVGLVYGAMIGDTVGKFTDGMTADQCRFHYDLSQPLTFQNMVRDEHRLQWDSNAWTSNVDHMILLMESVIRWGGVVDELDFAERLNTWSKTGLAGLDNGPMTITSPVLAKVMDTSDFPSNPYVAAKTACDVNKNYDNLAVVDSASLPRAVMLGVPHFYNEKEVASNSLRICCCTHAHPHSLLAGVTVSVLLANLLRGKFTLNSSTDLENLLSHCRTVATRTVTEASAEELSEYERIFDDSSLRNLDLADERRSHLPLTSLAGLIAVLRTKSNFEDGLLTVIMEGGASTVNGCVVGAVLGCSTGYSGLPPSWIKEISQKHKNILNSKLNSLLDLMGLP